LIILHLPIWRAGRLAALTVPYLRILPPVLVGMVGFIGLVELTYSASIGKGQGKALTLFKHTIDTGSLLPWVVPTMLLVFGTAVAASQRPAFMAAWAAVNEDTKVKEPGR
jgi:branched-chain amino acid transport system permease protein